MFWNKGKEKGQSQKARRFGLAILSVADDYQQTRKEQLIKTNSFDPSINSTDVRRRAFSISEVPTDETLFGQFCKHYADLKSNLNIQEESGVLSLGYHSDYRANLEGNDLLRFFNKIKYFAVDANFNKQSLDVQKHLILALSTFQNFLEKKINFQDKKDCSAKELKQIEKNYHAAAKDAIKALEKLEYAAKPASQKAFEMIGGIIGFIVGAIVVGLLSHFAFGGPLSPTGYIGAIIGFAGGGLVGFAKGAAIGTALFALGAGFMASAFGGFQAGKKGTDAWQTNYETGKFTKLSTHKFFKPDLETDPYIICRDMMNLGVKIIQANEQSNAPKQIKQDKLQSDLSDTRTDMVL